MSNHLDMLIQFSEFSEFFVVQIFDSNTGYTDTGGGQRPVMSSSKTG